MFFQYSHKNMFKKFAQNFRIQCYDCALGLVHREITQREVEGLKMPQIKFLNMWMVPYLLFWYQVLTCVSVRLSFAASSIRSWTLRYFCLSKLVSRVWSWWSVKAVLGGVTNTGRELMLLHTSGKHTIVKQNSSCC